MNRAQKRLRHALLLFRSSLIEFWKSDAVSGRLYHLRDRLERHPHFVRSAGYIKEKGPLFIARYRESGAFKERIWQAGILGLVVVASLYFILGDDTDPPSFDVDENAIHYRGGAPQLAFIRSDVVVETLLPLGSPLPARVAMDESRTAPVQPALNGRIVQQHAQLGDKVTTGDPLVTIDSPDYGTALTDWQKASADAKRKKSAYVRSRELLAGEAIARRDFEVAEADSKIADAEANRAYLRVSNLVPYGEPVPDSERLTLRAPLSGVIAKVSINPGKEVRSDQNEPLVVVSDLSHLWVVVDAPEQSASGIHVGDLMMVSFDTLPGQVFRAEVTRVSPILDPQMRRVMIRAELDNPDMLLRPEMFGRAQLTSQNAPTVARIPIASLITTGVYTTVFIETGPGTFVRKRVDVAYQDHQWAWLKPDADIKFGDRVVTVGALLLSSELAQGAK